MLVAEAVLVDGHIGGEAATPGFFLVDVHLELAQLLVEETFVVLGKLVVLGKFVVDARVEALGVIRDLVAELALCLAVGQMVQNAIQHDGVRREILKRVAGHRRYDIEVAYGELHGQFDKLFDGLVLALEEHVVFRRVLGVGADVFNGQHEDPPCGLLAVDLGCFRLACFILGRLALLLRSLGLWLLLL